MSSWILLSSKTVGRYILSKWPQQKKKVNLEGWINSKLKFTLGPGQIIINAILFVHYLFILIDKDLFNTCLIFFQCKTKWWIKRKLRRVENSRNQEITWIKWLQIIYSTTIIWGEFSGSRIFFFFFFYNNRQDLVHNLWLT